MSVCALRFVRAGALSHSDKGGKKDVGGGRRRVGDGVCEVTGEGGRSDGVLDGGRARGDECVLTV